MSEIEEPQPHSICLEPGCGEVFDSREEAQQHGQETLTPTSPEERAQGVIARGHATRTINPTPEERRASALGLAVSRAVEDAIEKAMEECSRLLDAGEKYTIDEISEVMKHQGYEFSDAWDAMIDDLRADGYS